MFWRFDYIIYIELTGEMPIKKIAQSLAASSEMKEIKQMTLNEIVKYQRANKTSPTNCIIAIIIIVFCLTICV